MQNPTFRDVLSAHQQIRHYLNPTPLYSYSGLNNLLGTEAYVKHENYQPVGAFKIRGGINLVAQLNPAEREAGLIAVSTGNHGQSVAYAGRLFGVAVRIVVPEGANPGKVAAMESMGAEVIFHGEKFDDARVYCEKLAEKHSYRYVHSGNEPHLIAGVATVTLEMLSVQPDINVIIVPIGGGSGASGACITAEAINPAIQVIGVQSEESPAAYQSWQAQEICSAPNRTFAEGLATGSGFSFPQQILWEKLHDFRLVSDAEIRQSIRFYLEHAHTFVEGAGAASLALAYKMRDELPSKKVGLILSGGNLALKTLQETLDH